MTTIHKAVEEYIALRRALGFKLVAAGMLRDFAGYLKQRGASHVTTKLALSWAKQPAGVQPAYWGRRLGVVRRFALHLSPADPRTEIPAAGLLPSRCHRRPPYLYSDSEIRRLLQAARCLRSKSGLRPATYTTLLGLLVVTGLRSSEVIALDDRDVDLTGSMAAVRQTKFRKARLVPLHPSAVEALRRYLRVRNGVFRHRSTEAFFIGDEGRRLTQCTIEGRFRKLCWQAGVCAPDGSREPRLHDFRHRLAVNTLIGWYRLNVDVEAQLPVLSTYLGHARVGDTYWYLTAVPELLRLAADRLERALP